MLIKKRLAISNVLMILVPIGITVLIGLGCIAFIWFTITHNTGVGFEDSEDFYQASASISELAADGLQSDSKEEQLASLKRLTSFLDEGAMSLVVVTDGEEFYRYGDAGNSPDDAALRDAAALLHNEGTLSKGDRNMQVHSVNYNDVNYLIYLYNTQRQLSYKSLKVALAVSGSILLLAILLSIFFTDRFLTRFVFKHIEEPLDMLVGGVRQIRDGNLDYRLDYTAKDEFLPVCRDFNDMARRLKESVERSRREEESRKELMAGISHDLRTPLTSIQAYVEGLLDGVAKTPTVQRQYLTTVKGKAEELETMVAHILDYSRLDLENVPCHAMLLQLDEYLKTELDSLSPDYADRGLDIKYEVAPFSVVADPSELHQLITNIADNSLKYKTADRGSLCVALTDNGASCQLTFADDGPGVPEETLGKLFDVFYRGDPSRSDRTKGSGLGLAIVYKTIGRMGGTVRADNAPQGGLIITIELPKGDNTDA